MHARSQNRSGKERRNHHNERCEFAADGLTEERDTESSHMHSLLLLLLICGGGGGRDHRRWGDIFARIAAAHACFAVRRFGGRVAMQRQLFGSRSNVTHELDERATTMAAAVGTGTDDDGMRSADVEIVEPHLRALIRRAVSVTSTSTATATGNRVRSGRHPIWCKQQSRESRPRASRKTAVRRYQPFSRGHVTTRGVAWRDSSPIPPPTYCFTARCPAKGGGGGREQEVGSKGKSTKES
jgi:hypothetical protein